LVRPPEPWVNSFLPIAKPPIKTNVTSPEALDRDQLAPPIAAALETIGMDRERLLIPACLQRSFVAGEAGAQRL